MANDPAKTGRPRSEQAKSAVLQAADDMLLEIGYAAMTMKGIAERAGVSRQTIYRWWSTKAEILLEASADDAEEELAIERTGDAQTDIAAYLEALIRFLSGSAAGAAYRALIGAAQQDAAVADLLATNDPLGKSAVTLLRPILGGESGIEQAAAHLIGPPFFWIVSGRPASELSPEALATTFLRRSIVPA